MSIKTWFTEKSILIISLDCTYPSGCDESYCKDHKCSKGIRGTDQCGTSSYCSKIGKDLTCKPRGNECFCEIHSCK